MPTPQRLFFAVGMALLAVALFAVGLRAQALAAQDLGLAITKTLVGDEVVRVGELLEFSIRITNTGSLPIVELELVDEFVGSIVAPSGSGPFAEPDDPPLSDVTPFSYDGAETIRWQLLGGGQRLDPGQSLEVRVRLRAIRPTAELQTVNRARIERAVRSDGQQEGGGSDEAPARPEGARLPMTKSLGVPAPIAAGLPITFTIIITNDGAIDLVTLPLIDRFNPAALRFERADPPPRSVDQAAGVLDWGDLLAATGRSVLAPGESIRVVTVYTALRDIDSAVNVAEVQGAEDEYGNSLASRRAEAPIRIVDETATPGVEEPAPTRRPTITPLPTAGPRLTEIVGRTATAAAAPTSTATLAPATATSEQVAIVPVPEATAPIPASLPNTGAPGDGRRAWLALALMALVAGAAALKAGRRLGPRG